MSHRHELHSIPEQWIRPTLLPQQTDSFAKCAWEVRLHVSSAEKQIKVFYKNIVSILGTE